MRFAPEEPMKHLILASGTHLTAEEQHILKCANWMGVPTKIFSIDPESTLTRQLPVECEAHRSCVVISADTLALRHKASPHHLEEFLREHCAQLLVFRCGHPTRHNSVLSWLTRGAVRGVSTPAHGPDVRQVFDLPAGRRDLTRQLAGLSFSTGRSSVVPTFDTAANAAAEALMLVNQKPVFIRMLVASCDIFLLAGSVVPDIDEPLSPENGIESYYDQLIPFLVFVRHAFPKTSWHAPASTGRLIIDDPLLTETYGFLDYRTLLDSMHRERYGTSIAFIPWNYRRTSSRTAASLFGRRPDLSICIHGCDHTNKEFERADDGLLDWMAGLALERMERHQARTGLPFERVMVFPQGRFSSDAMLALRGANYLAAVNSTCFPTDAGSGPLRIKDFLRPAITQFHGFPIFQRRYPRRLVDSAFAIFLGTPALLVEHHQYFRDGCENLEEFVVGLRNLEPTLTWPTLSSQFMHSCIMRFVSHDSVDVQFFTRRFRLENKDADRQRFRLAKNEPDPSVIRAVLVDGISVPFSFRNDSLEVELEVDPGQSRDIEIFDHPRPCRGTRRMGLTYNISVFARRSLSEFRDNTLAMYPGLLRAATGIAKGLKFTADRNGRP